MSDSTGFFFGCLYALAVGWRFKVGDLRLKMTLSESEMPDPKSSNTSKRKIVWAKDLPGHHVNQCKCPTLDLDDVGFDGGRSSAVRTRIAKA